MATCLVFAFAALIEFAVVNVLSSTRTMGRRFSLATLFVVQKDQEEKEIHLNQKTDVRFFFLLKQLTLYSIDTRLTHQQQTDFEDIVGKGKIARNEQFLLFT